MALSDTSEQGLIIFPIVLPSEATAYGPAWILKLETMEMTRTEMDEALNAL